jgi:hypothetical protein
MREMLEKLPEGDWLCEECQDAVEAEKKRLGKSEVCFDIKMCSGVRHFKSFVSCI